MLVGSEEKHKRCSCIGLAELTVLVTGRIIECIARLYLAMCTMLMDRSAKLKIVLAVLPYLVLALGSGFLHNHGFEAGPLCAVSHAGLAGVPEFSGTHTDRHDCPACSWAKSDLSVPLTASAVVRVCAVDSVTDSTSAFLVSGNFRLASSRAPPA